jgi:serine/threonine protein kinase
MINELGMLASVNCDTLIQFHSAYCNEGHIGVIIEYMDFGSLDLLMKREYKVSESGLAGISYQILWGLAYLHHDSNLHRDIKPGLNLSFKTFNNLITSLF